MFASVLYVFNSDKARKKQIFVACYGQFVHPTDSHAKEQKTREQQPKAVQKRRSFSCGVLQ